MSQAIIELLNSGTEANHSDMYRHGNVVRLPSFGTLIISGDLHGHRRNFERIVHYANLEENPDTHVILQEIIHGGDKDARGGCLSFETLLEAVRYKVKYPDHVHIIMSNHDTAFMTDGEVMKDGQEMNYQMRSAMKRAYGDLTDKVDLAMRRFMFSEPLAVRCENGLWISHSLPDNRSVDKFDAEVLDRELRMDDIARGNSAYSLLWGRGQSQETVDKMTDLLGVGLVVTGHQPQEAGWKQTHRNMLIISSEHNHGVLLRLDLGRSYTAEELAETVVLLAGIL
jgi:hypothetical protein